MVRNPLIIDKNSDLECQVLFGELIGERCKDCIHEGVIWSA